MTREVLITHVTVGVEDLDEAEDLYAGVLQLPVRRDRDALRVRVGRSTLDLRRESGQQGRDHLALDVAPDSFDDAVAWLCARTTLITKDGEDRFEGPASWDSVSVYFPGPSGSVLELIARRRLGPIAPPGAGSSLRGISEVGLAVDDVPAAVRELGRIPGLGSFGAPPTAGFAALGDDEGLLIVVATGRPWFPTLEREAGARTSALVTDGQREWAVEASSGRIVVDTRPAGASGAG